MLTYFRVSKDYFLSVRLPAALPAVQVSVYLLSRTEEIRVLAFVSRKWALNKNYCKRRNLCIYGRPTSYLCRILAGNTTRVK